MQTNHLSHFLLTLGLLPALQRGAQQPPQPSTAAGRQDAPAGDAAPFRPRIVSVASAMHHFGYKFGPQDPLQKQAYSTTLAYGNSKLAQVMKGTALACLGCNHVWALLCSCNAANLQPSWHLAAPGHSLAGQVLPCFSSCITHPRTCPRAAAVLGASARCLCPRRCCSQQSSTGGWQQQASQWMLCACTLAT